MFKPTSEQCDIILQNIANYYNPKCTDPHSKLQEALGVSRNEAKGLLYQFLWNGDGLFNKSFRRDFWTTNHLLTLSGVRGKERTIVLNAAYDFADKKEKERNVNSVSL